MTQDVSNGVVEAAFDAGALRSKAKNDPALALEALGVTAPAAGAAGSTPAPAPKS